MSSSPPLIGQGPVADWPKHGINAVLVVIVAPGQWLQLSQHASPEKKTPFYRKNVIHQKLSDFSTILSSFQSYYPPNHTKKPARICLDSGTVKAVFMSAIYRQIYGQKMLKTCSTNLGKLFLLTSKTDEAHPSPLLNLKTLGKSHDAKDYLFLPNKGK